MAAGTAFVLGLAVGPLIGLSACEKPTQRTDDGLAHSSDQGAARPMPVALAVQPHFNIDCFDVYAACKAVRDLPAVSADGTRIAIAATRDENARDEFVLTVIYLDSQTGAERERIPIMTLEDRARGLDPDTEAMSPALRATLEARTKSVDEALARGGFKPMLFLGVVDEERPGKSVSGLQASFDGQRVQVREGEKEVWNQPVKSVLSDAGEAGCSSEQIAELAVWVRSAPRALLARVSFTTAHMCDVSSQYQAWR